MEFDNTKRTVPRATISFHLTHEEKQRLLSKALNRCDTLSEYVRHRLLVEEDAKVYLDQIKELKSALERNKTTDLNESSEIKEFKDKLRFYENERMIDLLERHKGKRVKFKSVKGELVDIQINSVQDVFTVMLNSFRDA